VVGVIAVAGIGIAGWAARQRGLRVPVQVEPAARRDLVARVSASGEVLPKRYVDVGANVSGRITALMIEEGDTVRSGEVLVRIDSTRFEAATRQAEAALEAQRAELDRALADLDVQKLDSGRAEQMQAEALISAQDYDASKAQLRMKQATVEVLRKRIAQQQAVLASSRDDLEKTTVVAPMDGVVTRLEREEGEVVIGAQSFSPSVILTVADLSEMECEVMVDESDIAQIAIGQPAEIEVDALRDTTILGRVVEIGASAQVRGETGQAAASSASTGTQAKEFRVTIAIDAPPPGLRPGLNASAEIETARRDGALSVPIQSVVVRTEVGANIDPEDPLPSARNEAEGVFVVADGVARFRPVRTGIMGDLHVEVRDGLSEGDAVVSGPYRTLRTLEDETRVEIEEPGAEPGPW
jgi:HlyD family secretion protein